MYPETLSGPENQGVGLGMRGQSRIIGYEGTATQVQRRQRCSAGMDNAEAMCQLPLYREQRKQSSVCWKYVFQISMGTRVDKDKLTLHTNGTHRG